MAKSIIQVKNLNVIYFKGKQNQVDALTNINLEIYEGEFIIFFGSSGCGKSTLLYSIAGLERNIEGTVLIDDKNLSKFNGKELDHHRQKTIGMIFQAFYLISSLPVLKNIILPQFSLNIKVKDREKRALELMEFFGIIKQKDKYPNELSGGQQQRVAICRSLINEPQMILADEPTGNLDSKSAVDVMNTLLDLNEKQGKTVILVTHSPSSLSYAHRVFYMKDGKIIDIKVNRRPGEHVNKTTLPKDVLEADLEVAGSAKIVGGGGTGANVSKGLELLARTYSNFSQDQLGGLLVPFKAKQIVSEVLTNLSNHDLELLEAEVGNMLKKSLSKEGFAKFLDRPTVDFGLGLDKRISKILAGQIYDIISEIREMEQQEKGSKTGAIADSNVDAEVRIIRGYLAKIFKIKIKSAEISRRFDLFIKLRLKNEIDSKKLYEGLDNTVAKGGVNLDSRLARKLARRIELLILGKFK